MALRIPFPVVVLGVLPILAACASDMTPPPAPAGDGSAQASCLAQVEARTGTSGLTVTNSSMSASGTQVYNIDVGSSGLWTCITGSDGTVQEVLSPPSGTGR
ncbi:hypothetical protein [Pseudoruegeria sp. SK021]|uniref:hypothetical protein n=1 Tax=Pseudoruegeria sp. SK021 TaxID=1933035 RepID=UPI000A2517FA|nr:hypothetical protein [Pseudoruegeria sp. SK021]OSP56053.1 hypothetical protein BV911_03700 [Pseudoruegeria sp. SK021]